MGYTGVMSASVELRSFRAVKWGREGGELWLWKGRAGVCVRCEGGERYSGAQRIERAQEAAKRRAQARSARKLCTRPLLVSLHDRIRQGDWAPALEMFKLVREQQWYVGEVSTYLQLLTLLARARQPEEALWLFESLLEDNLRPTTAIFTTVLTALTKANRFRRAVTVFESMRLYEGCVPDKYTYTAMIKGCCEAGLYEQARKIFDEMVVEGVKPTTVTFNTLIFGYGKAGRFRDIERVLAVMKSHAISPDTVTWNTLIRVFGLHGKIPEMEQAYQGILAQRLLPDAVTLTSLISAYGAARELRKMRSVVEYMTRFSYPVPYTTLIEIYGKAGEIEEMEKAFAQMEAEAVKPTRATFCAMVSAYGQHGFWHRVDGVMRLAKEYGAVETSVYNAAIDAYQRAQNFEEMERMWDEMKTEGFAPDDITFHVLIDAYQRVMRVAKVQELQAEWDALKKQE